jgi:hypothetical protein
VFARVRWCLLGERPLKTRLVTSVGLSFFSFLFARVDDVLHDAHPAKRKLPCALQGLGQGRRGGVEEAVARHAAVREELPILHPVDRVFERERTPGDRVYTAVLLCTCCTRALALRLLVPAARVLPATRRPGMSTGKLREELEAVIAPRGKEGLDSAMGMSDNPRATAEAVRVPPTHHTLPIAMRTRRHTHA